jgi:hypothetical protein
MKLTTTGQLANYSGVKCIIYGNPGSGKTPLVLTAPNSIYVAIERGQVSLQGTNHPAVAAYDLPSFYEFMAWMDKSEEAKQYETFFFDSISHLAQLILNDELNKKSKSGEKVNGQAAYGAMAKRVLTLMDKIQSMDGRNIVMLAQLNTKTEQQRPYFPGNEIDTKLPHLFDGVFHLGEHDIPEKGVHYSLQMRETSDVFARCRFIGAANYERPDLGYLFNKLNGAKNNGTN